MALSWLDKIFINRLAKALAIPTPQLIPRSGEEGKETNCYSVYVTDSDGSYLADAVIENGSKLKVKVWDEAKRTHEKSKLLNLQNITELNFTIHHYYGLITHTYESPFDFLIHELTGFYKLQSKYALWKFAAPKLLYSKKKHKRPDRSKVLRAVIELSENNHTQTLDVMRILSHIYGMYAISHPQYPTLKQATLLIMKSLAESKEIELVNQYECRIRGKALTTMEQLQLDATERKRTSVIMWLTIVLAITALFQSKLVITELELNLDSLMRGAWLWVKSMDDWL
ncbi:hypothetical protein OQJ65_13625 [Vibrio sp. Sgm 22]|uniref:hypothetical protein n=1 Tax=unclassified Vibrio TaxID=2614977 RepID=UPI0022495D68|nr:MULTISPECIES: hypothetical protein [unclassified Vibrio]MCX2759119.1 hypothetical protein [Vibrio sp. 14G-20]MCX2776355.1 hypothetical protein [Vibrio sp. Sgm 22]